MMKLFRRKQEPERNFTGNCMVRQHTADGVFVGRCYHSTYDDVCHLHGNVGEWLADGDWPNDYDILRMDHGA